VPRSVWLFDEMEYERRGNPPFKFSIYGSLSLKKKINQNKMQEGRNFDAKPHSSKDSELPCVKQLFSCIFRV